MSGPEATAPSGGDADLRVGVVGMGIGHLHLLSWLAVQGASAVAVAETDPARRAGAAEAWGLPAVATLDDLLSLGVDVVDLCTPPAVHEEQVRRALDAGVHVVCEKPLVGSLAACDRLAVAAEAAERTSGARLMPIQQYRFGDGAARARALVEAGVTGRLYTASASTWWRRDRDHYAEAPWRGTWDGALGGTVVNHAIHIHDLLTWIGGPLVDLHALTATRVNDTETEDCAVAVGHTADGGLVTLNATTGAAVESSRLVWHFEHVTIESATAAYDPGGPPWQFAFRSPDAEARAAEVWEGVEPAPTLYTGQLQAFVDALPGGPLPVTLADAAATLELVTAFYTSARTGASVALPLDADHPARQGWGPRQP
ncbi:MAG: Gfo/Idh/MocA family oxidoreductase [Acidimicrobiales bacterium]|nr:Gfo/Idh/MocA family oxidoreductase [Acidimicrobiales bacterium]